MSSIDNIELQQRLQSLDRKVSQLESRVTIQVESQGYLGRFYSTADRPVASKRNLGQYLLLTVPASTSKIQWCLVQSDGLTYEWVDGPASSA